MGLRLEIAEVGVSRYVGLISYNLLAVQAGKTHAWPEGWMKNKQQWMRVSWMYRSR